MKNGIKFLAILFAVTVALSSTPAFAKKDGDPAGWAKGEKKGWEGGNMPPGLSKKDAKKAENEAKKAEKKAKADAKKAEKEAKNKQKEAEKAAEKAKTESEKAVS